MNPELFVELQRRAPEANCKIAYAPSTFDQVNVYYEGQAIGMISESLIFTLPGYTEETIPTNVYYKMQSIIHEVREYVSAYQNGHSPSYGSLPEGYRILTSYNNVFLAARKMERGGYEFVCWQLNPNTTSFENGRYSTDYQTSKMYYVTRSQLLDSNLVFSSRQLIAIQKAVDYILESEPDIEINDLKHLQEIKRNLEFGLYETPIQEQQENGFGQTMQT